MAFHLLCRFIRILHRLQFYQVADAGPSFPTHPVHTNEPSQGHASHLSTPKFGQVAKQMC